MKFVIFNISAAGSSILINILDEKILKEAPYAEKLSSMKNVVDYNYILVPLVSLREDQQYNIDKNYIRLSSQVDITEEEIYSIYRYFKDREPDFNFQDYSISFDILNIIDSKDLDIFYTDGSYKDATKTASYACCKLLETDKNKEILMDDFSKTLYSYDMKTNSIPNGTNNIGELTGLKIASENFGGNTYQVIISDSIYSIKSFREWYYNWKNNGFRNAANKEIANKDLIESTYSSLNNKNKIVLFKWTRGHNKDYFNELCDKTAKKAAGVI
jgi:ribonuclease HI